MAAANQAELPRVVELCLEQSSGTVRGRNPYIEALALKANKLTNCGLNFLFAHAVGPTGGQVRLYSSCLTRRKFAVDGQK